MIGQTISHYKITGKLGEGGMGEVYRAEDTSLGRTVALKFLSAFLKEDPIAHKRFLREARSAAALDHPFICKIYETGQTETDQDFIAMEYVEGQTLGERLAEGPLSLVEALKIAAEVADALELAHERGIVHRDLKPANIMLTPQGHAKVMDFGLAKRIGDQGQEFTATLTQEGAAVGTLAYMSPEQLQGKPLDTRSDMFSFGVVLYQMLSGVHPFRKGESIQTITAILHEGPVPLSDHLKHAPEPLSQMIGKMLAKDPQERFQSVAEVRTILTDPSAPWVARRQPVVGLWGLGALMMALAIVVALVGWWSLREGGGSNGPIVLSIAVLPLANLSGDPEQEYFADGMTDALITDLSKIGALKVIARSSAMRYKGTEKPPSEIALELKVDAVLEGSVLREGDRVRINAQLIEASTDRNLWADRYESEMTSIMALQGEVARAIARQIQVTVTPGEETLLTRTRPVNPEAYEAYLKGVSHWGKLTPADLETALQYYELALKKDPDYAPAYSGIALAWAGLKQMGIVSPDEAGSKMEEAVQRALELDDNSAEAHYALAAYRSWTEWNWEGAEEEYRRAIELNPNFAEVRAFYSHFLMIMKRQDEALVQMQRALELDPFNSFFQSLDGVLLYYGSRRYDDAIKQFRTVLPTAPNDPLALTTLAQALYSKGMDEEAYETAKRMTALLGVPEEVLDQGYREGGFAKAMSRWAEWYETNVSLDRIPLSNRIPFSGVARLYARAGETDRALEWLDRAFDAHDPNLPYIGVFPDCDGLHDEPRFQKLLRRLNFPEDVLARYLEGSKSENK